MFSALWLSLTLLFQPPLYSLSPSSPLDEQVVLDALKTTITPSIHDTITGYYGDSRKNFGIYGMKVLEIKRHMKGGYSFLLKVQVDTFEGAHNPPYGRETVWLEIYPGGISVQKFEHQDVP
jgi:hypothetical protein